MAPGAGGAPALAGESLARFIVHRVIDVEPYRARSVRIEEIGTIEDACSYVREHSAEIPEDLFRRVWEVRAEVKRRRLRELANTYSIRSHWKQQACIVSESHDWLLYEVRRHAVAELESLLGAGAGPPVPSSNAGTGIVEEALPAPGAEHWRLAKTPRNMEAFVDSLCQEESRF